jgi:hypothetical protein
MLERWYSSDSSDEGSDLDCIAAAANSLPASPGQYSLCSHVSSASGSVASARTSESAASSIGSRLSLLDRRKSKLRARIKVKARSDKPDDQPRNFHCTFCVATFKTKGNWTRHESTVHLVNETWICAPKGTIKFGCYNETCVFCGSNILSTPSARSRCTKYCAHSCSSKTLGSRTFSRKDGLKQHLKKIHNVTTSSSEFNAWKYPGKGLPGRSRCGICGDIFPKWRERNDHIADHFNNGESMEDCRGDWGLSEQ